MPRGPLWREDETETLRIGVLLGRSAAEIGEVMGRPATTIRMRASRMRLRFARQSFADTFETRWRTNPWLRAAVAQLLEDYLAETGLASPVYSLPEAPPPVSGAAREFEEQGTRGPIAPNGVRRPGPGLTPENMRESLEIRGAPKVVVNETLAALRHAAKRTDG